ncbi:diaminopropionate ammonia-lyase [Candidatus Pelagibacter sp.]|nr:diaminopropionate ammonia-lyase [Candidatus Pelagibacter sp.]
MKELAKISSWEYSKFLSNKRYNFSRKLVLKYLSKQFIDKAYKKISKWKGYSPTPLTKLNKLNKNLKLKNIFYKDESKRFHLKSFKALGGAYAVEDISKGKKNIVISSATAGNHGRSVAWGAQRLGLECRIFVSQYVSETRVKEIEKFGATVTRVKGDYESSLNECIRQTKKNKWHIVQDVSNKNYKYVPQLTMAGYSIMIKEISKQTNQYITHVFLQAGVGGMAAGSVAGIARYFKRIPKIIVVEPKEAACVLKSIEAKKMKKIKIKKESIMGGMSCNEMSLVPWNILNKSANHCITIDDSKVSNTVAMLAKSKFSNKKITGGECATPGIISLIAACNDKKIKNLLELNEKSNVLVMGCEGNADATLYNKLLSQGLKKI